MSSILVASAKSKLGSLAIWVPFCLSLDQCFSTSASFKMFRFQFPKFPSPHWSRLMHAAQESKQCLPVSCVLTYKNRRRQSRSVWRTGKQPAHNCFPTVPLLVLKEKSFKISYPKRGMSSKASAFAFCDSIHAFTTFVSACDEYVFPLWEASYHSVGSLWKWCWRRHPEIIRQQQVLRNVLSPWKWKNVREKTDWHLDSLDYRREGKIQTHCKILLL